MRVSRVSRVHAASQLASPIKLTLELEKQVGIVWVKVGCMHLCLDHITLRTVSQIPCVDNIGSCTYDDACTLLEKIPLVSRIMCSTTCM